jgi:hypothetical protein
MNHDQILAKAPDVLSPRELEAARKLGSADKLSPQTAAQLFVLYCQGYDSEQIATQNPSYGSKGLGLIARARIEFDWDGEKSRYLQGLMSKVRETVEKSTMESIQFASDGMAVFHKMAGTKFRKYLQTGNSDDLGEFANLTFKQYRDFVSLLQTLTGQDQEKHRVDGEVVHRHVEEQDYKDPAPVPKFEDVLKMLEEGKV